MNNATEQQQEQQQHKTTQQTIHARTAGAQAKKIVITFWLATDSRKNDKWDKEQMEIAIY
uniref:Uncharacterized protein n=1 Tax=Glossina palpalis gambiensis TaxID=67801 RepID=A0A1B0BQF1_9MUSC